MNEPSVFNGPDKTMPLDLVQGEDNARVSHAAVHNLYGMMMSRATQEGLRRFRPNERPFVLTRAGYAGIQRYAAVWLGDNSSWWEHIKAAAVM
jgi:alpha-glucosidase